MDFKKIFGKKFCYNVFITERLLKNLHIYRFLINSPKGSSGNAELIWKMPKFEDPLPAFAALLEKSFGCWYWTNMNIRMWEQHTRTDHKRPTIYDGNFWTFHPIGCCDFARYYGVFSFEISLCESLKLPNWVSYRMVSSVTLKFP